MARARNIMPGFFQNEILGNLPMASRLLFIGLWTVADREGRLEDRPGRLRGQLFPYDYELDMDELLDTLHEGGFIRRYEVGGEKFIQILTFKKHQRPHPKEKPSLIPVFNESDPRSEQAVKRLNPGTTWIQPFPSVSLIPDVLNADTRSAGSKTPIPDSEAPAVPVRVTEISGTNEAQPLYWSQRIYERHPKARNKPLVEDWICRRFAGMPQERFVGLMREIDRVHSLWCDTGDWQKDNGRYVPKLDEWLADDGWKRQPKAAVERKSKLDLLMEQV